MHEGVTKSVLRRLGKGAEDIRRGFLAETLFDEAVQLFNGPKLRFRLLALEEEERRGLGDRNPFGPST